MHINNHKHRENNIKTVFFLNVIFTIIEVVGGLLTNSLAILSDALHDFGDTIALATSWLAEKKAKAPADGKRTYGYQRLSLFSALFTGIVLVSGSLFILYEAIPRVSNPEYTNAQGIVGLAIIGIIINGLGVWRLKQGQSQNEKVLSWHLLEDVLGWVVILIGGIIMYFVDSYVIDPIMTIGFTVFVLWGVGKNLKNTLNILMQGVPDHINIEKIKQSLLEITGIKSVHDIHIWSLDGETDVFSGHIVVEDMYVQKSDDMRKEIKRVLTGQHIEHSTIELESDKFCSGIECKNNYSD